MKYQEILMETKFEKAMELSDEEFRRLCGYTKKTMLKMVSILRDPFHRLSTRKMQTNLA